MPKSMSLHRPVGHDLDVRGLEVAVQDVVRVRVDERGRESLHDLEVLGEQVGLAQPDLQAGAGHVLHDEVGPALVEAEIVDDDDVRVGQRADDPRLVPEPLLVLLAGREHHLHGDRPSDVGVLRQVHLSHRSLAESLHEVVLADRRGDIGGHGGAASSGCRGSGNAPATSTTEVRARKARISR
jgi:hypothetical protein